jgi:hypothetical protein
VSKEFRSTFPIVFLLLITAFHPGGWSHDLSAKTLRLKAPYISPNEEFPQRAGRIFESATEGTYVSVGTERGFIGASNSANISSLEIFENVVDRSSASDSLVM